MEAGVLRGAKRVLPDVIPPLSREIAGLLALAHAEADGDPVAAITSAANACRLVVRAVYALEHGDAGPEIGQPRELAISWLYGQLVELGVMPDRVARWVNVAWTHKGTSREDLNCRLYSRTPGRLCHDMSCKVVRWFFGEYLRTEVPSEARECEILYPPPPPPPPPPRLRLAPHPDEGSPGSSRGRGAAARAPEGAVKTMPSAALRPDRAPHPSQEAKARSLGVPSVLEDQRTGIVMVLVPGGEVWVGASPGDPDADDCEFPRYRVRLRPFYIGIAPVLQREWQRLMGRTRHCSGGNLRPVEAGWNEALEFLRRANEGRPGPHLRLPTEAEWECAARGGTSTAYWWGPTYREGWANCSEDGFGSGLQEGSDVGLHPANPYGLFDVHGNAHEACQDGWQRTHVGASVFGLAREPEGKPSCVLRGGSWANFPENIRVSVRCAVPRDYCFSGQGFRCARDAWP